MTTSSSTKVAPAPKDVELGTRSRRGSAVGRRGSHQNAILTKLRVSPAGKKVNQILDSPLVQGLLSTTLMVSLFLPDIWIMSNISNEHDAIMNWILTISFVIFVVEMIVTSICKEEYFKSFFFYMDVLGTLSILIDITWISNAVMVLRANANNGSTLRAARVAKIGARSGRLIKFLRLFTFLNGKKEPPEKVSQAHRISRQLGQMLSQRVAALIMFLVIVNPFMSTSITDYSAESFLTTIEEAVKENFTLTSTDWNDLVTEYDAFYNKLDSGGAAVALPVNLHVSISQADCPTSSKYVSYDTSSSKCIWDWSSRFDTTRRMNKRKYDSYDRVSSLFDNTTVAQEESLYSVILILIVMVLLVGFTALFNSAVEHKVVSPIQRIMDKLRTSTESVLESVQAMAPAEEDDVDEGINEADILEMMVNKLTRIVSKSMGSGMPMAGVDERTQAWLSHDYSSSRARLSVKPQNVDVSKIAHSPTSSAVSTELLPLGVKELESFQADLLAVPADQLAPVVRYLFDKLHLLSEFNIDQGVFSAWMGKIQAGYLDKTYHCWHHACDVTHTVYLLIVNSHAELYMSKLEVLACMMAALAHDIAHPGVNNGFLVKTKHELALLHNDKSPLENMHAATLYEILRNSATNITANMTPEEWIDCRKQVLTCILNTDMAVHFQNFKELEVFEELHGESIATFIAKSLEGQHDPAPPVLEEGAQRLLIQHTFIHAADLSNPVKATPVYEKWVKRVTDEFFSQGDKEKEMGIDVSPMCDRDTTNIPNMQLGFIDFVIAPFYCTLFKLFPESIKPMAQNLKDNYFHYAELRNKEVDSPEEVEKLEKRKQTLAEKVQPALEATLSQYL